MPRLHQNFIGGELSVTLGDNSGGTDVTLTSPALEAVGEVDAPFTMDLVLDPDGIGGEPEVVTITSHATGTGTATITRAQEGSLAREHKAGIEWAHGGTAGWANYLMSAIPAISETTTARTLALTDAGLVVECTNASATTVTIPSNADVAFPIGTIVNLYAAGAGGVVVAAGSGVTIRGIGNVAQYNECSFRKRDTNEWVQVG